MPSTPPRCSSAHATPPGCPHCGPRPGSHPGSSTAPAEPTCTSSLTPLTASPDSTPTQPAPTRPAVRSAPPEKPVAAIGGTFRLHSPPNVGTGLRVELPLGD